MALISVLGVLLLLTLLVVAFMGRATSARLAANRYRATVTTRLLADYAVNLVQAQINEATTLGLQGGKATYTWGSQPGAIRVFDDSGNLNSVYRLYSATPSTTANTRAITGTDTPGALAQMATDIPANASWTSNGAQWVDLNAPAKDSESNYHFPILDPRDPAANQASDPTTVKTLWQPASGNALLKGFSIQAPATVGTSTNPAPMPVRWFYILKDGSIVSPDAPGTPSNILTFKNAVNAAGTSDVPTVLNPIIGRIAYWTDDDSSKININTAGGDDVARGANPYPADSIFWATPAFSGPDEANLAALQPVNEEIQRYPGHPGTVGLNSTLSALMGMTTPFSYDDFYTLMPRYAGGGSRSGTVVAPYSTGAAPAITPGAGRLYTSVGEMLFVKPVNTGSVRTKSVLMTDSSNAPMGVERANFFLTAHSAAPELNLFGEPRVSVWPLTTAHGTYTAAQCQTPIDLVLAFDSTLKTISGTSDLFYFQRTDPTSGMTDCNIPNNISLLNYLDVLTSAPIPGFGGTFADKYSGGTGANTTSTHQILSEIFDYIRTINMADPVLFASSGYGVPSRIYGVNWGDPNQSLSLEAPYPWQQRAATGNYQVVPSFNGGKGVNNWGTQGVGGFPYPVEIAIDFAALGLGRVPVTPPTVPPTYLTPEKAIPWQQYKYPALASDTDTTTGATDTIVDDTSGPSPGNGGIQPSDPAPTTDPVTPPIPIVDQSPANGLPADNTTAVQAFVYVSFANPSQATSTSQPSFVYSLTGLNGFSVTDSISGKVIPLHIPGNVANINGATAYGSSTDEQRCLVDASYRNGFINGFRGDWVFGYISFIGALGTNNYGAWPALLHPGATQWTEDPSIPLAGGGTAYGRYYPFYSQLFCLTGQQTNPLNPAINFGFSGGTITLKMYDAHQDGQNLLDTTQVHLVSTYTITFPGAKFPMPGYSGSTTSLDPYGPDGAPLGDNHRIGTMDNAGATSDRWHLGVGFDPHNIGQGAHYEIIAMPPDDTVESVTLSPAWSDVRDLALYAPQSTTIFAPHPNYGATTTSHGFINQAQNLRSDVWTNWSAALGDGDTYNWGSLVTLTGTNPPLYYPVVPPRLNGIDGSGQPGAGAYTTTGVPGDWDNGSGPQADGPWVNMPDAGTLLNYADFANAHAIPYFSTGNTGQRTAISTTFSPNRQMPSPAMFGSLPTGVIPGGSTAKPWQTLLFRPGAHAGGFSGSYHPGEANQPNPGDPADHMLLDLFWMPQAEPYPISQPLVTEGKINLNYEIQPFTYITRDTALRALLGSEKIAVMPDSVAGKYKALNNQFSLAAADISGATGTLDPGGHSRLPIDVDQTLGLNPDTNQDPHAPTAGITTTDTAQTNNGGITNAWYDSQTKITRFFHSESELCDMFLVPQGYDWQEFSGAKFDSHSWYATPNGDFALVGDNTRERPYANLYSRVTTKSNTYTVYCTVQSLKNAQPQTDTAQGIWNEATGAVTGEYRGSTIIERYLDSNSKTFPDYLNNPNILTSLEPYYKWRVLETRQFAP